MTKDPELLKNLYKAYKKAQARIAELENRDREPLAIVGMACRFPGGADDPESYWQLLERGTDAVGPVPAERWSADRWLDADPEAAGKMYSVQGGFLRGPVADFDAGLFNISPKEARALDPQQRLLLEVSWQALENAGIPTKALAGTDAGVFVGISGDDYSRAHRHSGRPETIDAYSITGTTSSTAAGRLSYFYDLRGPATAIDTACSSSLVALHLAAQSLRRQESSLALVAGVNLILAPELHVAFSKLKAMSTSGRCHTFAAQADGYVRGEGCGVLVLKRLRDARSAGDQVLALVRGTAVNQDGRSNGFTAPNGNAQKAVIRQALANAGLEARQISYLEAHGTGTQLGDVIEMEAIGAAYGRRDEADDLRVGSVKTNIGHLEAAAGVAGLIKLVLSLRAEALPAHLHFKDPNPRLDWQRLPVRVNTECQDWPRGSEPRYAALSSFGFSGTNAHVIVGEAPPAESSSQGDDQDLPTQVPAPVLTLSAAQPTALDHLAQRYIKELDRAFPESGANDRGDRAPAGEHRADGEFQRLCQSSNERRGALSHRLALAAASPAQARRQLSAFRQGRSVRGMYSTGRSDTARNDRRPVFLFPGQGTRLAGMGRQLFESEPVFRETLSHCDQVLEPLIGRSLLALLYDSPESDDALAQTRFAQPALFALSVSMVALWRSLGITPGAVMGHSVGELAAAHAAGVLTLDEGLHLIAERGRLMQSLAADGAMWVVHGEVTAVEEHLRDLPAGSWTVAAINGPRNLVISGAKVVSGPKVVGAPTSIGQRLSAAGLRVEPLPVSHAFHSAAVEPILAPLQQIAARLPHRSPRVPWILNLTGEPADRFVERYAEGSYWSEQARSAVLFARGLAGLRDMGFHLFLEVGPGTGLSSLVRTGQNSDIAEPAAPPLCLPSLRRGRSRQALAEALAQLFAQGHDIQWSTRRRHSAAEPPWPLPGYPFQRKSFWALADAAPGPAGDPGGNDSRGDGSRSDEPNKLYALVERPWQTNRSTPGTPQTFHLHGPAGPWSEALAQALEARGQTVMRGDQIDPDSCKSWRHLVVPAFPESCGEPSDSQGLDSGLLAPLLDLFGNLPDGAAVDWVSSHTAILDAVGRGLMDSLALESSPSELSRAARPRFRRLTVAENEESKGEATAAAVAEVLISHSPSALTYRQGQWWQEELVPRIGELESAPLAGLDPEARYLVTGGTGDLGLAMARHLVERGARHLILVSRRGPKATEQPAAKTVLDSLSERATVELRACDLSRPVDLRELLDSLADHPRALKGIVHAAGIAELRPLGEMEADHFLQVWRAKAEAARALDRWSRDLPLDFFCCFGSVAGLWGSARLAHYSAANAFLNRLVADRQAAGLPAQCISWGPWRDTAMVRSLGGDSRLFDHLGFEPLDTKDAAHIFDRVMAQKESRLLCAQVNWPRLLPQVEAGGARPLFDRLRCEPSKESAPTETTSTSPPTVPAALRQELIHLDAYDRPQRMLQRLQERVAEIAGFDDPDQVAIDLGFFDMGLDSLMAVTLRQRLESDLGLSLRSTLAFDFPNLRALSIYLLEQLDTVQTLPSEDLSSEDLSLKDLSSEAPTSEASPSELHLAGAQAAVAATNGSYDEMRRLLEQALDCQPEPAELR